MLTQWSRIPVPLEGFPAGSLEAEVLLLGAGRPVLEADVAARREADRIHLEIVLTATGEAACVCLLRLRTRHAFGVGLFAGGVVQRTDAEPAWVHAPGLRAFYAMSARGSAWVTAGTEVSGVCSWSPGRGSGLDLIVAGADPVAASGPVRAGTFEPALDLVAERVESGERRTIQVVLAASESPAPALFAEAVRLPDPVHDAIHALALWGSQVPSLGSLELPGSVYPTVNLPRREYGELHTFFDPDAWSVVAALSFAGVDLLYAEARAVLERAFSAVSPDGLAPHHFAREHPEYVAISGSPQPGPNLFLIEAAIDHACARGDLDWLDGAWRRCLSRMASWLLRQRHDRTGLLEVDGALWVDVFRRRGLTLDTNAMAIRTFGRAAELAERLGDPLAERLRSAADEIRKGLQLLWNEDHFVTSIDPATGAVDDHVDAENYLAIAVGAATSEQSEAILRRFDGSPLTHPGGRGTWVSLRRYDGEDCYLHNTGDSDIAMARLWWADLLARVVLRQRDRFLELYDAVARDLMETIWMRERYAAGGHPTRARGYHEYPGILDMMLREGVYGIRLGVASVEFHPMRSGPFEARFGSLVVAHSPSRARLCIPGGGHRTFSIGGLLPDAAYEWHDGAAMSDGEGVLTGRTAATDDLEVRRSHPLRP